MQKMLLFISSLLLFLVACQKPKEDIRFIDDLFRTNCIVPVENPTLEGWDLKELSFTDTKERIFDLFFISNEIGYATVSRQLLKTEDAGETWNIVPLSIGSSLDRFSDIFFLNKTLGWALAYRAENCENTICDFVPTIWKTNDAGITWTSMTPKTEGIIGDLYMKDELNGFCLVASTKTGRKLLRTNDGGASWSELPGVKPGPYHFQIRFADERVGFILGEGDIIYKTTDGGNNWLELHSGLRQAHDFILVDANTAYLTDGLSLLKTTDGGESWQAIYTNESAIRLVHFRNKDEGIVFLNTTLICSDGTVNYYSNISVTENGGTHWKLDPFGFEPYNILTAAPSPDFFYMTSSEGLFRFVKK